MCFLVYRYTEELKFIYRLSKEYYLGLTYHIAKVSLQNKLSVKEGKQALAYCKANFNKNRFFNQDDLKKLEELI